VKPPADAAVLSAELDEAGLQAWGLEMGRLAADRGVFVCLYGELGAGKSTLARAACRGAGVRGAIPSPTFTLINQYEGSDGAVVFHADLYRIERPEGLGDMGWDALVQSDEAVFVEWADRAARFLPEDRWDIRLDFAADATRRGITARVVGQAPLIPPPPAPEERAC
jgi:tRNA threonylcarbamoyladenosine biosynthesis protein TsaE